MSPTLKCQFFLYYKFFFQVPCYFIRNNSQTTTAGVLWPKRCPLPHSRSTSMYTSLQGDMENLNAKQQNLQSDLYYCQSQTAQIIFLIHFWICISITCILEARFPDDFISIALLLFLTNNNRYRLLCLHKYKATLKSQSICKILIKCHSFVPKNIAE